MLAFTHGDPECDSSRRKRKSYARLLAFSMKRLPNMRRNLKKAGSSPVSNHYANNSLINRPPLAIFIGRPLRAVKRVSSEMPML